MRWRPILGNPDKKAISTSRVERHNSMIRMSLRPFSSTILRRSRASAAPIKRSSPQPKFQTEALPEMAAMSQFGTPARPFSLLPPLRILFAQRVNGRFDLRELVLQSLDLGRICRGPQFLERRVPPCLQHGVL